MAGEWASSGLLLRSEEPGCGLRAAGLAGAGRSAAARRERKAVAAADSWARGPAPPRGLGRAGRAAPSGRAPGPAAGGGAGRFRPGGVGRGAARRNARRAAGPGALWRALQVTPLGVQSCGWAVTDQPERYQKILIQHVLDTGPRCFGLTRVSCCLSSHRPDFLTVGGRGGPNKMISDQGYEENEAGG